MTGRPPSGPAAQLRRAGRVLLLGLTWLGLGHWPVLTVYDEDDQQLMPPGRGVFSPWP